MSPRYSEFASPSETRRILEHFGLSPKKGFGQNFLVNDQVVFRILELAEIAPDDTVLEVGPGIGTLTSALLKQVHKVVAVEKDPSLPEVLSHTLATWKGSFALIQKDALDLKQSDLGEPLPDKFVANLPYSVAATLVLDYFQRFAFLQSATVMVQKEVAERMMAKPGTKEYGAYTVKLSLFATVSGSFSVSPGNFMPAPHVDSTVIRLDADPLSDPRARKVREAACLMADAAFASRRKTIVNSCKTFFAGRGIEGTRTLAVLPAIFAAADVDPQVRGETLSREVFWKLGEALLTRLFETDETARV